MARAWKQFSRRLREVRLVAKGAFSTSHPVMAHIIPTRRCNLSCTYCNEYDDVSKPVDTETMIRRINHLADLGTGIITLSGGEPFLRPDLVEIVKSCVARCLNLLLLSIVTTGHSTGQVLEKTARILEFAPRLAKTRWLHASGILKAPEHIRLQCASGG